MVDTATYIYYADDDKGTNPSSSPQDKKYIGFYSGPSYTTQPTQIPDPNWKAEWWSGWIKYVGDDGKKGDSITITDTSIKYAKTSTDYEDPENIQSSQWKESIPTLNQGEYLWTRTIITYSDGTSTTSYSKSYLGKDGDAGDAVNIDSYRIEFSQEEILKFVKSVDDEGKPNAYSYSPESLFIHVYKNDALTINEIVEVLVNGTDITNSFYFTTNPNNYKLDIKGYLDSTLGVRDLATIPIVFKIKEIINEGTEEQSITIKAIRPIVCRNGINSDMATFALNATGINAAIQSTALAFNAQGLTVTNGGIKIVKTKDNSEEVVFESDGEGNLRLKGEITATKGYIGNITIENNSLVGNGEAYTISPTGIVANNIILKQGAQIDNYIQLGNSYLYNPDAKDSDGKLIRSNTNPAYRAILQSGKLLIKDTGFMSLGEISFFGGSNDELAYISAKNNQWQIWENGRADFQDIYANNCHIGNTILEVNTIQAAGNLTIYADSWSLVEADDNYFLVDKDPMLTYSASDPIIFFGKNKYYKLAGEVLKDNNIYKIPVDKNVAEEGFARGDIITKIGKVGEAVMCVSGQGSNRVGFATESSLTLSFLKNFSNGIASFETKMSLGLLDKLGKPGVSGYGLYAENVYLRGSLTTVSSGDSISYAGINTTSGAKATVFESTSIGGSSINDNSAIIFWAGAGGTKDEDIQAAPFQVTERGTLYAAQGVFEGSIISKSTIQGSDIYAARIHGWKNSEKAPLTIYDTDQGIVFKTGYENENKDGTETLRINSKGLFGKDNKQFILLDETSDQAVTFQGKCIKLLGDDSQVVVDASGVKSQFSDGQNGWSTRSQLNLGSGFSFVVGGIEMANFTGDLINLKSTTTSMTKHVQFGGESVNLLYKQTDTGYDLYVN